MKVSSKQMKYQVTENIFGLMAKPISDNGSKIKCMEQEI